MEFSGRVSGSPLQVWSPVLLDMDLFPCFVWRVNALKPLRNTFGVGASCKSRGAKLSQDIDRRFQLKNIPYISGKPFLTHSQLRCSALLEETIANRGRTFLKWEANARAVTFHPSAFRKPQPARSGGGGFPICIEIDMLHTRPRLLSFSQHHFFGGAFVS